MKASGRALILFFFMILGANVSWAQFVEDITPPGEGPIPGEVPINFGIMYLILGAFGLGIKKLIHLRKKR